MRHTKRRPICLLSLFIETIAATTAKNDRIIFKCIVAEEQEYTAPYLKRKE